MAAVACGLTIHSSRTRFAGRLNSGVRPHMTDPKDHLPEALVVVERDGVHRIEIREVLRDGDFYFLVFATSDGSTVRVPIDGTKLKSTVDGRVPADLIYNGGALAAPQQEV